MTTTFSFDGRDIPFRPGQTVGGALLAAGVLSWRSTRIEGSPRGLFCGIGVCFDCLVTVDARSNQRACQVVAHEAMTVRSQDGTGHDAEAI
ncbi:MAG: (2Fe-2S)-binding protein [Microlunatus sp.]|nr:(2Fe-2S)-binding protein [Microlunatus sp.]MDN5770723.1 (2Fe-2S)-binding protein [Microlunatus sp.]